VTRKSSNCVPIKTKKLVRIISLLGRTYITQLLGQYIELVDTFPNLGPIVDFTVVDLERQGQV